MWINLKDKLPQNSNDVLVVDNNNKMYVSCYFYSEGSKMWHWEDRMDQIGMGEITHWKPLPPFPENDEEHEHLWTWFPKGQSLCLYCGEIKCG